MHSVDFFVAQRAFVRAIFESQGSRSFVVGDTSAFVGADKTYAGEIIRLLSFGSVYQLPNRDAAIHEQRH